MSDFEEWFDREAKPMMESGCSVHSLARAAWNAARRDHEAYGPAVENERKRLWQEDMHRAIDKLAEHRTHGTA